MSREIKFRAWHKERKFMAHVSEIEFDSKMVLINSEALKDAGGAGWFCFDEMELIQFTGLYDKNGVEIFEGDILVYQRFGFYAHGISGKKDLKHNLLIVWDEGSASFKHKMYDDERCFGGGSLIFSDMRCDSWEVEKIGTNRENPELLEPAK